MVFLDTKHSFFEPDSSLVSFGLTRPLRLPLSCSSSVRSLGLPGAGKRCLSADCLAIRKTASDAFGIDRPTVMPSGIWPAMPLCSRSNPSPGRATLPKTGSSFRRVAPGEPMVPGRQPLPSPEHLCFQDPAIARKKAQKGPKRP